MYVCICTHIIIYLPRGVGGGDFRRGRALDAFRHPGGNRFNGFRGFCSEKGLSQGQNLAVTGLQGCLAHKKMPSPLVPPLGL